MHDSELEHELRSDSLGITESLDRTEDAFEVSLERGISAPVRDTAVGLWWTVVILAAYWVWAPACGCRCSCRRQRASTMISATAKSRPRTRVIALIGAVIAVMC